MVDGLKQSSRLRVLTTVTLSGKATSRAKVEQSAGPWSLSGENVGPKRYLRYNSSSFFDSSGRGS